MTDLIVTKIMDYEKDGAFSTVVQYNDIKILLDCGVNKSFDVSNYQKHIKLLEDIDLVLISSAEIEFCGALPYLTQILNFYEISFTTVPLKYLININLTINTLFLPYDFTKTKKDIDHFHSIDILLNRLMVVKFNQTKNLIIRGKRVKFTAFHRGDILGACYYEINVDKHSFCYLVNETLNNSPTVKALNSEEILKKKFDFLLTYFHSQKFDYDNIQQYLFKKIELMQQQNPQGTIMILIDQIPKIFDLVMTLNKVYQTQNKFVVYLPKIYNYYIDINKRLSEYMIQEISQNISFEENDYTFKLDFVKISSVNEMKNDRQNLKIVFATPEDLHQGEMISYFQLFNSKDNMLIQFCDYQPQILLEKKSSSQNYVKYMKGNIAREEITNKDDDTKTQISQQTEQFPEEIDEENQDINYNYFDLKNGFIEFVFQHEEKLHKPCGVHLSEQERKCFNTNNFDTIIMNKENIVSQDLEKTIIKKDEFYMDFLDFLVLKETDNFEINYSVEKITAKNNQYQINQLILLSHIKITQKMILLNFSNPFDTFEIDKSMFRNQLVPNVDHQYQIQIKSDTQTLQLNKKSLEDIKLKQFSSDILYSKVMIKTQTNQFGQNEIVLSPPKDDDFYIFQKQYLLNLFKYLNENGYEFKLKFKHLNYQDKIFFIKLEDRFLLEGPYSLDYFMIRQLIYRYNNEEIESNQLQWKNHCKKPNKIQTNLLRHCLNIFCR